MTQKSQSAARPKVGDRVKLSAESFTRNGDMTLQGKIAEVVEVREDGNLSVRFDNGRLLMGRSADTFDLVGDIGLTAKK
jgi:hypothetical protein